MIVNGKTIFRAFIESFKVSFYSVNKWFHLVLILFFISGGVTFLWVPENLASRYLGIEHEYWGWMTHLRSLSGYSFKSYWFNDLSQWLFLTPSKALIFLVGLINILISTFVRIKVTQILFENEYLFGFKVTKSEYQDFKTNDSNTPFSSKSEI